MASRSVTDLFTSLYSAATLLPNGKVLVNGGLTNQSLSAGVAAFSQVSIPALPSLQPINPSSFHFRLASARERRSPSEVRDFAAYQRQLGRNWPVRHPTIPLCSPRFGVHASDTTARYLLVQQCLHIDRSHKLSARPSNVDDVCERHLLEFGVDQLLSLRRLLFPFGWLIR